MHGAGSEMTNESCQGQKNSTGQVMKERRKTSCSPTLKKGERNQGQTTQPVEYI